MQVSTARPSWRSGAAAASPAPASRLARITESPRWASWRQHSRPRPRLPPVTSAVCSISSQDRADGLGWGRWGRRCSGGPGGLAAGGGKAGTRGSLAASAGEQDRHTAAAAVVGLGAGEHDAVDALVEHTGVDGGRWVAAAVRDAQGQRAGAVDPAADLHAAEA